MAASSRVAEQEIGWHRNRRNRCDIACPQEARALRAPTITRFSSVSNALALVAAAVLCSQAWAESPTPLADINPEFVARGPVQARDLQAFGGRAFFLTSWPYPGSILWTLDPAPGAATPLVELSAGYAMMLGATPSHVFVMSSLEPLRPVRTSDGTTAGTSVLMDDATLPRYDGPITLGRTHYSVGGRFLFLGVGAEGREVWSASGAPGDLQQLSHFPNANFPILRFAPYPVLESKTLFFAKISNAPDELWVTDGTPAGTLLLASSVNDEYRPEAAKRYLDKAVLPCVVFGLSTLCVSDGTVAGTHTLSTVPIGNDILRCGQDFCYSSAGIEPATGLWRTDGTMEGTFELPIPAGIELLLANAQPVAGGLLARVDGDLQGRHLRFFPASGAPSEPLNEPCVDPNCTLSGAKLYQVGERVVFRAGDSQHGTELWSSDGTAAGTFLLVDVETGSSSGYYGGFHDVDGILYFAASSDDLGQELWRTDGTPMGTWRLSNFEEPIVFDAHLEFEEPLDLVTVDDWILFIASTPAPTVWKTQADWGAAVPAADISATGSDSQTQTFQRNASGFSFLGARYGLSDWDLWTTERSKLVTRGLGLLNTDARDVDGPVAALGHFFAIWPEGSGYRLLRGDAETGSVIALERFDGYRPSILGELGGWLYFARSLDGTTEIRRSQGDAGPSDLVTTLAGAYRDAVQVTRHGNRLFFVLSDQNGDRELFATDGSESGTVNLEVSARGARLEPFEKPTLLSHSTGLYFEADDGNGNALWRSDGTVSGTARFSGPELRLVESNYPPLVLDDAIYFFAGSSAGVFLFRTEGSAMDIAPVAELPEHISSFRLGESFAATTEHHIVMTAGSDATGIELWSFAENGSNFSLLKDIQPGPRSSVPGQLTSAGGQAFFRARDDLHGAELWRTDGTTAGTHLEADIHPGPGSSSPNNLSGGADALLFDALHPLTGREPWILRLDAPSSLHREGFESGSLAGWSETFPVANSPTSASP